MTATYQARPSAPPRAARQPSSAGGVATAGGPAHHRTTTRRLHPWAWWAWALGTAAAVSFTTNPLLVLLCAAAVVAVTLVKRSDDLWARSIAAYLWLALAIVAIRLVFQVVLGGDRPGTTLFTLPEVPLPQWAAGIRLGGPVQAEYLLVAVFDALRLATMLLCVGAANALANPRRALRSVPSALYEVSVAVVIALTVAPQLVVSALRARRARRLRGGRTKGLRAARSLLVPVLEDAVEQSLALAAGMEARGFGRTRQAGRSGSRLLVSGLVLAALVLVTLGLFTLLSGPVAQGSAWWPAWLTQLALPLGLVLTGVAFWLSGRQVRTTRHRPDPWRVPEWIVLAAGLGALLTMGWLTDTLPGRDHFEALRSPLTRSWLNPPVQPLAAPQLHPLMLLVPAWVFVPLLAAPRAIRRAPSPAATTRPREDT
ncbi:CbiQ family ECF transporter T component [Kytococcus sedentarius]|uniref:CbiQ family ECF transporter T component n=1 Tax=Kytococcus sedentarius TaxID=1276 RepID=UPI0035BBCD10